MADLTEKDVRRRLDQARQYKIDIEADLMEGYFFTAPRRAREVRSKAQIRNTKSASSADQAELHTTLGIECADDFVGMIIDAFMPPNFDWARRSQGMMDNSDWSIIKNEAGEGDAKIMAAIKSSNLYSILKQAFFPDLSLGTCGLWIEDAGISAPPDVRPIPIRDLDIGPGPGGTVGDRFVTRHEINRNIPALLPRGAMEKLPMDVRQKIQTKPDATTEVNWCLIMDTSVPLSERWIYMIHAGGRECHREMLEGEGSCPLVIPRFDVDPTSPWADGPTLKALPYLRIHDAMAQEAQDNAEFQNDPSFIYPSDGIINFEGGLQTGMAYPASPGFDRNQVFWLRPDSRPEVLMMTADQCRQDVRRLHYSDFPEQRGKTPPTASQWIDEMVKLQKRIGLSGETFWREGPRAIYMRFKHILERRGTIRPLQVNGQSISLEPYNPAIKGQEFQEVQMAERLLSLSLSYGGVQAQAMIDMQATFISMQEKLGDKLVTWMPEEKMKDLLTQLIPQADVNIGNTGQG